MAAVQDSIYMKSSDLIKKEPLDYGGFGTVYLCYHKTLGQVVLKTVYTGPPRNEGNKQSLLEEGSLMTRLNHERVVKLLGVILEDGDYSLVMELIPKGNLLAMLDQVSVPISIKGRIILEILEGMVYLMKNCVIHKDLKPENILVDKDFHIKIADLGLATCQTWSRLTKEESRRQSRLGRMGAGGGGARAAGTLCYMAPEHLDSIHTRSSEKSDIYSFAIVVWVILTASEPFENARSEDHICQCVRKGDRPDEYLIPDYTPVEIIELMKRCWHQDPQLRPTFGEGYNFFLPVYREKLEPDVERDSLGLRDLYEGPEEMVEKMKSLSMPPESLTADRPAPLLSSDSAGAVRIEAGPVEASIEDLNLFLPCEPSLIQPDARALGPISTPSGMELNLVSSWRSNLDVKLAQELEYHKFGSYCRMDQPDFSPYPHHATPQRLSSQDLTTTRGLPDLRPSQPPVSSVQSWTKTQAVQPSSVEVDPFLNLSDLGLYESAAPSGTTTPRHQLSSHIPESTSSPSLSQGKYSPQQQYPYAQYDRLQSWPAYPVPESAAPDLTAGLRLNSGAKVGPSQDPAGLFIQNASGIQIGSNNTLSIRGHESYSSLASSLSNGANSLSLLKENLPMYEDQAVTEEHLDLLRDNIGKDWKRCARRLGLSEVEVETIDHDYQRDGLPEKVHQMLERWRMKEGCVGCTVGRLCRALENCVKVDLLKRLLHSSGTNSSL
ncbi:receptor-interacting serine/threonine-protein kinase 1 isoform X1 [Salvelinus sp. IW2-2015]|uniref:receptor-interacting serine/threonine-protein kinase 1 isoform X1 n=1 Tax=Salvelinus sp. IW2-2015 TaxID=2691554 RepID=UPI000CDFB5DF|nr:receptor-interacting serine/threonine-protein kinase 1 isoform X1 [Salvelinus alpinus]XP_023866045.1 receptor-interacting serine/threonine-protein kinase 1 isoform X1 [Salvelinus alpinus]XP_023866046.1 receptor-interacting serine/threonine-protein kinase 1 isoform X1 [Salvelinus alpinus]